MPDDIEVERNARARSAVMRVLERIADAMTQTLREERQRIPGELLGLMSSEWDAGRAVAVSR